MPSIVSRSGRSGACGVRTVTSTRSSRSALARRKMKDPAASPDQRGNACVRKRTRSASRSAAVGLVILALLVQPSLNLSELRTLRGDLLAEHARREEDATEEDAGLNDGPDPSLAYAVDPEPRQRHQACQDAEGENGEAKHREQEQRLLPEAELEPD